MLTWDTVEAAFAVSAVSVAVAKSHLTEPVRDWARERSSQMLSKLLDCPFCLSFWAAGLVALWLPQSSVVGYVVNVFALVGMSALISGAAIKLLHLGQHEYEALHETVDQLREEVQLAELARDHYHDKLRAIATGDKDFE